MTRWFGLVALIAAGAASPLQAADLYDRWDGVFSARSEGWSGTRNLDDDGPLATASFWAKGTLSLDRDYGQVIVDGWLRRETRDRESYRSAQVRRMYWRNNFGPVTIKLGREITAWGRADGINPTDKLCSRDYTMLAPEDSDLRVGNEAAQVSYESGAGVFSVWWFFNTRSDVIPLKSVPNIQYLIPPLPHRQQWAARWDWSIDHMDGALSYFQGYDPFPDISFASQSLTGIGVHVSNNPVRVFGADLSFGRGRLVWRAEAAFMDTGTEGAGDFQHKKRQLTVVASTEWNPGSDLTISPGIVGQKVFDFGNPDAIADPVLREIAWMQSIYSNQIRTNQFGLIIRVANMWLNNNLTTELSYIRYEQTHQGLIRTKIDYAMNDRWHIQAGTESYFGDDRTFFGQSKENALGYVQLRNSF